MHGLPPSALSAAATPTQPQVAPLASLLVRSGALKGRRLPVKVPVVNIGRADFNDVVIADPSVSTSHAKLQRRDDVWVLTDLGSTNGTFVEGERLSGEVALGPGTTVKFGEVAVLFEPLDESAPIRRSSGTQVLSAVLPSGGGTGRASAAAVRDHRSRGRSRPRRPPLGRAARSAPRRPAPAGRPRGSSLPSCWPARRRPTSSCADPESCALHLRRTHRRRHRPLRERGQLPHARRARRLHRRGRDGGTRGGRGGERDGGPDHVGPDRLAARPVGRAGGRPGARRHPGRQRRDLRADARGARQAGHGDDGHGAGADAAALPHRPGRRQPGLPAPERRVPAAHQGPLLRAGAGRCGTAHARSRRGCIPTAT